MRYYVIYIDENEPQDFIKAVTGVFGDKNVRTGTTMTDLVRTTTFDFYNLKCLDCGHEGIYQPPIEDPQCEECRSFLIQTTPITNFKPCIGCGVPVLMKTGHVVNDLHLPQYMCEDCREGRN